MTDLLLRRFANEQLVNSSCKNAREVVSWFGAVQGQEFYPSNWALGLRIPGATEEDIIAAINSGSIIKTWAMRGTLHYVAADDFHWIMKLVSPRMIARFTTYYRKIGLTPELLRKSERVIVAALQGKSLIRSEIRRALVAADIPVTNMRGMFMIGNAVYKGLMCWGPRKGKQFTFKLVDEWVPKGKSLTHDQARIELARRYFRSHGPATIKDYVWWSSLTVKDAKFALEHLKEEIVSELHDGLTFYGPRKQRAVTMGMTDLLPIYDEYTVAFKDRHFFDKKYAKEAMLGMGYLIVRDGKAIGTWKRTSTEKVVHLTLKPFVGKIDKEMIAAAQRYADFLEKKLVIK